MGITPEDLAELSGTTVKMIKTGNGELDRKMGGIPIPTFCLIEGANDTGKSVICQQIAYGALKLGLKVRYVTTENTVASLISQLESLNFHVTPYFLNGAFRITELHTRGIRWSQSIARGFLKVLLLYLENDLRNDVFFIDSLTYLVTHADEDTILEFFSSCRNFVDDYKKTLFITLHPFAFKQEMLTRIRSICDGHINVILKEAGDKTIRIMDIAKLKGVSRSAGNLVAFEVNPAFGIRVLPFSQAKA